MKQYIETKLGVAVILILAVTVGAFVWKWEKRVNIDLSNDSFVTVPKVVINNQKQPEKNIPILKEIGENNEIAINLWKSYTSKSYGYSIKYPPMWTSSSVDGTSFFNKKLIKPGENFPNFGNILSDNQENLKDVSGDYFINISVYKEKGNHTNLKEWRKNDGTKYEDVLIKGYPTLKFDDIPHIADGKSIAGSLRYYFIDKNNDGYEITIWYKDKSNGIGDQIISTLAF